MYLFHYGVVFALIKLCQSSPIIAQSPSTTDLPACTTVTFQVYATAINKDYTPLVADILNFTKLGIDITTGSFKDYPVSGTQDIVARYCEPAVKNKNHNTLQFFVHAITTNKNYWSGLGFPGYQGNNYSWIYYASQRCFPTLSIDRLGNGQSSHPDPVLVVQAPYEIALYHTLIQSIKSGTTGQAIRTFTDIVYIGHSAGQYLAILTGFTATILPSLPGAGLTLVIPAALQDPVRFGTLPAGYLAMSSEVGRTNFLFGSSRPNIDYDIEVAHLAYTTEDTVSIGQLVSAYGLITVAPSYEGRILILTGEEDEAFCGPGSPVFGPGHCGSLLPDTKTLFPNSDYNWHSLPHTGHFTTFEYTHTKALNAAHQFLAGKSFKG